MHARILSTWIFGTVGFTHCNGINWGIFNNISPHADNPFSSPSYRAGLKLFGHFWHCIRQQSPFFMFTISPSSLSLGLPSLGSGASCKTNAPLGPREHAASEKRPNSARVRRADSFTAGQLQTFPLRPRHSIDRRGRRRIEEEIHHSITERRRIAFLTKQRKKSV